MLGRIGEFKNSDGEVVEAAARSIPLILAKSGVKVLAEIVRKIATECAM
jgi:hypothetical protein